MNKCQDCGRQYGADVLVRNKTWERIKPTGLSKGGGLLCGGCIVKRIEALEMHSAWRLVRA